MGKLLPQKRLGTEMNNIYSIYLFLHLNVLNELLFAEEFDEEVVNYMIMH